MSKKSLLMKSVYSTIIKVNDDIKDKEVLKKIISM